MARLFLIAVLTFTFLSAKVDAQDASIQVSVKAVDLRSHEVTVNYTTDLGDKTATLDVSRNAKITINGEAGVLEELKPGHEAIVNYHKELAVVTKIEASGEPLVPELVAINEITGNYLSLTTDGLTAFWEARGASGASIFTATRERLDGYFKNPNELFPGRHPAISSDGLECIFLGGPSNATLHVTTRESVDLPFRRAREIAELKGIQSPKSPFLSADGLMLCLNRSRGSGQAGVVFCTRENKQSKWTQPKPLAIQPSNMEGFLTWPSLTLDQKTLLLTHEGTEGETGAGNLLIWRRTSTAEPFRKFSLASVEGIPPLKVRAPRLVETTGELFFSAQPKSEELTGNAVIKNFPLP
ncbi:hypothetical protein N9N28_08990 [Rubripirellula amarantea]|nr:hypothetical protein [Rubripirellula amarantea]